MSSTDIFTQFNNAFAVKPSTLQCLNRIDIYSLTCMREIARYWNTRNLILSTAKIEGEAAHANFSQYPTTDVEGLDVFTLETTGGFNVMIPAESPILSVKPYSSIGFDVVIKDDMGREIVLDVHVNKAVPLKRLFTDRKTAILNFLSNYNELTTMYMDEGNDIVKVIKTKQGLAASNAENPEDVTSISNYVLSKTAFLPYENFYRPWLEIIDNRSLEIGQVLNLTEVNIVKGNNSKT